MNFSAKIDKDINKFEKQNPGISVNVFGYQTFNKKNCVFNNNVNVYPRRISEQHLEKRANEVNLLLISNKEGTQYYCLIKI